MRMAYDPLLQLDLKPEAVDSQRNDAQQEPLDPVAEQPDRRPVKGEPVPGDHRVLRLPVVDHGESPGQADTHRADRDQASQQRPPDQLKQAAVEIRHQRFAALRVRVLILPLSISSSFVTRTSPFPTSIFSLDNLSYNPATYFSGFAIVII